MTETMAESSALSVGSRITSRQQITDLPVGSVISGRYDREVKVSENRWQHMHGNGVMHRSDQNIEPSRYDYRLVEMGTGQDSSQPVIGAVVSDGMFTSLPPTTVIRRSTGGNSTWTRTDTGWLSSGGTGRAPENMRRDVEYIIVSMPPAVEPVDTTIETPVPGAQGSTRVEGEETLEEYKARLRTVVYASQQASGVSRDPIDRAFRKLGIATEQAIVPGMPVCLADSRLVSQLPNGTMLVQGKDPARFHEYGVWGKQGDGRFVQLAGGAGQDNLVPLRVMAVPGVEAPEQQESSESEHQAIRQFMRRVWDLGLQAKVEQSWCGEFERAMSRVGIDRSVMHDPDAGLTAEQVAALPVDTILRVVVGTTSASLYVRDDAADNPAKTRWIGGSLSGSWAQRGMTVVRQPNEVVSIPVYSYEEMNAMPYGTTVTDGGTTWTKRMQENGTERSDRNWFETRNSYAYRAAQFSVTNLRYSVIPR